MAHNYAKHFGGNPENKHQHFVNNKVVADVNLEEDSSEEINEVVETVDENEEVKETENVVEYINGVVSGCEMLNVRKEDNTESDIVTILYKDSIVQVDLSEDKETDEFYKVVTSEGVHGYCMKKFITIN